MAGDVWGALLPHHMLTNDAIIAMAGPEAFARGMVYARTGQVGDVQLNEDTLTITGRVRGSNRNTYLTSVRLADSHPVRTAVPRGHCSCPVSQDCKHAAALLVVARSLRQITRQLDRPGWEKALGRLVEAPDPVTPSADVPLGLEFEVQQVPSYRGYPGRRELQIRPVKRGRSGRWIRSGISWDDLDFSNRSFPDGQRDLLLQIRAATGPGARFVYPKSPWITLDTVAGGVWSLLDAAKEVGLALVFSPGVGGTVSLVADRASVRLDARRVAGSGLTLLPQVLVGEAVLDLDCYGLLGDPAHGLFSFTPGAGTTPHTDLRLASLADPLTSELRQLVTEGQPLVIPAGDEARFLDDFYPRLRHKATIVSADESVSLPGYLRPVLTLGCHFRPEHRLRLDWGWRYQFGASSRSYPLDQPLERGSPRDPAEEQRLLTALPLPYERLSSLVDTTSGHRAGGQPRLARAALLVGLQAVEFTEQVLPELERCGVEVAVDGEVPDYRRVDTAPLVELSTQERDDSSDWFDLHIQVSLEGEMIPFDELFVALAQGDDFLILDTGVYLPLDTPEFDRLKNLIDEARALQDRETTGLRINRFQAGLWEELLQLGVVVEQSDRWAKTVSGLIDVTAVEPVEVPSTLDAQLRPYQVEGYRWLAFLWAHGLGGILADDMGLGKTLQALALVCHARQEQPAADPFLVVAPTSVVSNWAGEAAKFAPGLVVVTITESEVKRKLPLAELVRGADLVITSYTLLRIDEAYQHVGWAGMLLDEAQFVKNHRAKTYQSARRLVAPFKLAITGTPLENNLMDLWSLLSITAPGLFPHPERFSELYRRPIERGQDAALLSQLRRRIRPLLLRRTKQRVAPELPAKQEQVLEVVLQPRHMKIYQTHLQRERQKVLGLIDDLDKNRFSILSSLTLLRQLSLDPSLVDEAYTGVPATKIDVLTEHLDELVQEGHRALVFSQFTSFLGRVKARLDDVGVSYTYLDGSTRHRAEVVESFRSGQASVFLVSLKAGGFGLNLTEADYCFVLDPWWNPAAEAQAVDRTHRIGQTKTVMVYRLVAKDTIEEKVMELKSHKEHLFSSVLSDAGMSGAALTAEEIRGLFGV